MAESNICPACGAPNDTKVCAFCGTLLTTLINTREEREALDEFHRLLAQQTEDEKRVEFLQNGFIPEDSDNLIDAGIRSVALIDMNSGYDNLSNGAANRLRAITLKLKIMEPTPEISRAVSEFTTLIDTHTKDERRDGITTWIAIVVVVFLVLGACMFGLYLL